MADEDRCKQLDALIRDYIMKENLDFEIRDETPELPWRHYKHQDFEISTELLDEEIGIYVVRGEDPLEGYCAPSLFSVSQPEDALVFFDYFVRNHPHFLYQAKGFEGKIFNYFDEEKLLDKIKDELKLEITEIPQRLDFRNAIRID